MPFPFVAPLKEWTVEKLKQRESNRNYISTLSPFAMMMSGAVVMKNKSKEEILNYLKKDRKYPSDAYFGCVITNTTDTSKLYQTGDTIVGYDLNGKEIKVEGEKNRRVSTPIIESIEIDTDGGNNTLKTAQVKVRVFTLKQLEMFELFFLRPSMNVVLEYGWSSDIRNKSKKYIIDSKLFAKKNFETYKKDYSELFLNEATKGNYIARLKETEGEYDYMVGKVTSFSYSPQEDGTYDINIEVSSGNELQLWPAVKSAKTKNVVNRKDKTPISTYKSFIKKISSNLGINAESIFAKESVWKQEFFNYGITNEKQKNTVISKTAYISMKAIIEIINNLKKIQVGGDTILVTYEYDGNPIIPVNSNPNIISTNEYVLFPGKLPDFVIKNNKIELSTKNPQDCQIYGKSFNLNNKPIYDFDNFKEFTAEQQPPKIKIKDLDSKKEIEVVSNIGNLLNVFFSYDRFLEIYEEGTSIADIVNPILQTIQDAMLGLCQLELQKPYDTVGFAGLEIIDRKISQPLPVATTPQSIFRFKIGAQNSIVKVLTFNMEMSTLMQAQALYSSQLAIAKRNDEVNADASKEIDVVTSADLSYSTNADGYFSINDMEVEIITRVPKKKDERTPEEIKTDKEKEQKALDESLKSKHIKFLIDNTIKNMIYKDSGLIQLYMLPKSPANSMALTYMDISLEIDGLAGFSCGEYFQIDGIPEVYNKNGYFQITNVKQGIDENGWKTTIEAGYLIKTT